MKRLLSLILILFLTAPLQGALTFGAVTSDRVNIGSGTTIDNLNPLTFGCWIYPTTITSGRRIMTKGLGTGTQHSFLVATGGNLDYIRGRGASQSDYITNSAPIVTTDKWYFVVATYDSAATPAGHIYTGDLTSAATEATYATASDGSGTVFDDSANDLVIGNRHSATFNVAFQGKIAACFYNNAALSLGQIIVLQWRPTVISSTKGFWLFGYNNVGTQTDYSGNGNAGTITGSTLSDPVPLGAPFAYLDLRNWWNLARLLPLPATIQQILGV